MYNRVLKNYRMVIRPPSNSMGTNDAINMNDTIKQLKVIENINLDINKNQVHIDMMMQNKEVLDNAKEEAEKIIEDARVEALRIIDDAKRECDELKKKTKLQAEEKGYKQGYDKATSEYKSIIDEARLLREQARQEFEKAMASIEKDAVQLVIDIAKKVLDCELSQNKESILSLIKQAVMKCNVSDGALLRLSEQDYEFVQNNISKLRETAADTNRIEIKKDPVLSPGSCILETSYGYVDAGVDTQLEKITELFSEQLGYELSFKTKAKGI